MGILDADLADVKPPELELSQYGFTEADLDKQIALGPGILPHFATGDRKTMALREIIKLCKRIYCKYASCKQVKIVFLKNFKVAPSVSSTYTFPTETNVIGSESGWRFRNRGTTRMTKSA